MRFSWGKKATLIFVDLKTGKTKQTLQFPDPPYNFQSSAIHLPPTFTPLGAVEDRYLMNIDSYRNGGTNSRLIKYNRERKKYFLGAISLFEHLLPTSKAQKKAMESSLDIIFVEVKAPVPKEIVKIVAGFV